MTARDLSPEASSHILALRAERAQIEERVSRDHTRLMAIQHELQRLTGSGSLWHPRTRKTDVLPHGQTITLDPMNRDGARLRVFQDEARPVTGPIFSEFPEQNTPVMVGLGGEVDDDDHGRAAS